MAHRAHRIPFSYSLLALGLLACGGSLETDAELQQAGTATASLTSCPRWPLPADRPRRVVISHPYDKSGGRANLYEVMNLAVDGKLTQTGATFQMGRLIYGKVVFTPDGAVGLAAQEDGSIGVFRFEPDGSVHVVHAALKSITYAMGLVMDPSGERVYILNNQWRESGGGVYAARIGCDGSLLSEGLLAAAKLPAALVLLPPPAGEPTPRMAVAARDFLDSPAGDSVHLLRRPRRPMRLAGADGFGDDEAIVSTMARTADSRYLLIADNSAFSGIDNRIAVVAVAGDALRSVQTLSPMDDPVDVVLSPFNNAGLVVSGFGDALYRLSYDPTAAGAPFVDKGQLTYVGRRPQLPYDAVLVERGRLLGRVLIAELSGVRQVAFRADGTVTDLGLVAIGSGIEHIVGGIGVQP